MSYYHIYVVHEYIRGEGHFNDAYFDKEPDAESFAEIMKERAYGDVYVSRVPVFVDPSIDTLLNMAQARS